MPSSSASLKMAAVFMLALFAGQLLMAAPVSAVAADGLVKGRRLLAQRSRNAPPTLA
ncbi:hypothetical protein ACP4OV_014373 [Aristida adscensionis]